MIGLNEEIGRITTMLETAYDEQDWKAVKKSLDDLDDLYDRLDRGTEGLDYDYD